MKLDSSVARRLALLRQALELEDLPVAQHRHDDLVAVRAQVVDAGDGHLDRLALEPGDVGAGHPEPGDHVEDRLHRLVGRELQRRLHEVAVEDHVEVLVGRDPGEQPLGHRVVGVLAGVAVADPGRELLEGDVGQRVHHRVAVVRE